MIVKDIRVPRHLNCYGILATVEQLAEADGWRRAPGNLVSRQAGIELMIERSKKIELALKVAGTILVLLTMVVGIGQYFDTAERNFKRYFWERQLDVYERAVHLAAELSVERDRSTRQVSVL